MKKLMKSMLAALLALTMVLGCAALAEDAEKSYTDLYPESRVFDSQWAAGSFKADLLAEDEGFRVTVIRSDSLTQRTVWDYSAQYNGETRTLEAPLFGCKTRQELSPEGEVLSETVEYEDGAAVFSLNDAGALVWEDRKEDAGKGLEMGKIGRFEGRYLCDRAVIEILWEDGNAYSVQIEWADSAFASHVWMLTGTYDPAADTLRTLGMESVFEYAEDGTFLSVTDVNEEGCAADFSFNENGTLCWSGTEGVNTEGMEFEYDYLGESNG